MPGPHPSGIPDRPVFRSARSDPPFWRSPEFTRFAMIALIALGGAAAFLYSQRIPDRGAATPSDGAATRGPSLPATASLTPEQKAEREAYLATAFEGALRDQDDGAPLQDTTGYRKLLEHIAKYDAEDFSARTQRPYDHAAAVADPAAWRGQFVRVSGLLGEIWAEKLSRPVAGRENSWRAQIGSGDEFSDQAILEFIDRPFPEATLKDLRWSAVEVEGIFYRSASFDSEFVDGKGRTIEATWTVPWIFVRNIRLLDGSASPTRTFLNDHPMLILGVLAFVIFGGRLLVSWVQSRRRVQRRPKAQPGIREMFEQKLREKGLPPAPPSPPKP